MNKQFQRDFQHRFGFAVAKCLSLDPLLDNASVSIERYDLCGEGLSRVMLGVWDKILVGLQQIRAISHLKYVLDLLPWDITGFNRPSSTDKADDLAKDGVYR